MYHTSPNLITPGTINNDGIAGSCLFFSNDIYVMTASPFYYLYEADFNCLSASQLYDEEIISEIARMFNCDEDEAERLLDGRRNEWDFDHGGELSWWLQGKRGECAVKMGYDGCKDFDEQGTVYIVPMLGRESELTLIDKVKQR